MNILIIAPHPDDEVLGCGGTITKHINNGDHVFLCIMTKGDEQYYGAETLKVKRQEAQNCSLLLGIQKVFFLDFIAAHLDTVPLNKINHRLREIVEEVKPNVVYIPHLGDPHHDHQITAQCAIVAAKLYPSVKKILCYEALSETEQGYGTPFAPTIYVNISAELPRKLEALSIYKSELREYPHPRSLKGAEIKARSRGLEVGVEAAEAFMLLREIA